MTTLAPMIQPGTPAWTEQLMARMRHRQQLGDGAALGLKVVPAEVAVDAADDHLFTARITKNISDRDDEALLPSGMIASEFDVSGAVFWNHDYDRPVGIPVGALRKTDSEVIAKARFLKRPESHQGDFFPDFVRAFVAQMSQLGRRPGVSVGFIPLASRAPSGKDKAEYGPDVKRIITRWKLLEWSIAPVQANPEAYVTAVGKSLGAPACKALFGVEVEPATDHEEAAALNEAMARRIEHLARAKRLSRRARQAAGAAKREARVAANQSRIHRAAMMRRAGSAALAMAEARRKGWPLHV